jgi:hypothetical protein
MISGTSIALRLILMLIENGIFTLARVRITKDDMAGVIEKLYNHNGRLLY